MQILLLGGLLMFLFGCKGKNNTGNTTNFTLADATEIHFTYDNFSGEQFYLDAIVNKINDKGAKLSLKKRVGPMNYTGKTKEGTLSMNRAQVDELFEILGRYDLKAYSELPKKSASSSPSRTLYILKGDDIIYAVPFNAKFPETLPPEEDILYYELFNFFNDIIAREPGWEEVIGVNLNDPRENSAYYDRTVTWFGREVKLVPGTGTFYEDGSFAEIDYEGKDWWVEEGFTGEWTIDPEHMDDGINKEGSLTVNTDGSLTLVADGETYTGKVGTIRRYNSSAGITLNLPAGNYGAEVVPLYDESYEKIRISCYPGPVPEPQFDAIDIYLKNDSKAKNNAEEDYDMNAPELYYQGHASARIETAEGKVIYIDPFAGDGYDLPADLILITHDHFDHTQTDLIREKNPDCVIISQKEALEGGTHQSFDFDYVKVEAVEAGYNRNHNVKDCVGYVLTFSNDAKVYFSGDTSKTPQMAEMDGIDYAFFCCDGVYNMGMEEASECAKLVGATHSIPYHMIPADPQNNFDEELAETFDAEGRIILKPGDYLPLEK